MVWQVAVGADVKFVESLQGNEINNTKGLNMNIQRCIDVLALLLIKRKLCH